MVRMIFQIFYKWQNRVDSRIHAGREGRKVSLRNL